MQNLIRSREFWTLVVGALVSIIVSVVPTLESSKTELVNAIMVIVGVIITSFGAEKIAAAAKSGDTKIERLSAK